jgi:hypothetical protein
MLDDKPVGPEAQQRRSRQVLAAAVANAVARRMVVLPHCSSGPPTASSRSPPSAG